MIFYIESKTYKLSYDGFQIVKNMSLQLKNVKCGFKNFVTEILTINNIYEYLKLSTLRLISKYIIVTIRACPIFKKYYLAQKPNISHSSVHRHL